MTPGLLKFITEFLPLILFFISYKLYGILPATAVIVVVTLITTLIAYVAEKRIPYIPLISALILAIFGGLTLLSGDSTFIKMKPTIINIIFATVLLGGAVCKKGLLRYLFENALPLKEEAWVPFSVRWALFFIILAILNELVWRHFTEDTWVTFKVFGILPLTMLFGALQIPFIIKHRLKEEA